MNYTVYGVAEALLKYMTKEEAIAHCDAMARTIKGSIYLSVKSAIVDLTSTIELTHMLMHTTAVEFSRN